MQEAAPVQRMRMKPDVHQTGSPWKILDCLSFRNSVHFLPGSNPVQKRQTKQRKICLVTVDAEESPLRAETPRGRGASNYSVASFHGTWNTHPRYYCQLGCPNFAFKKISLRTET